VEEVITIGLDLAKVFQVHGIDAAGKVLGQQFVN
jgi:hypothetical protein